MTDLTTVLNISTKQKSEENKNKKEIVAKLTPSERRRQIRKAEFVLETRIEEIAIENYDSIFRSREDVYDKKTKIKTHGFHDYEKVDEWKNVI